MAVERVTSLRLHWHKCTEYTGDEAWCRLADLDLSTVKEHGVYAIWCADSPPYYVYVGQGNVADRLEDHLDDVDILTHENNGTLMVTWATVPQSHRDGVERFLADKLRPFMGHRYPDARPIEVNRPGQ